jgi:RNA polymerase sigma-70 factor, ECF subfamily
MTTGANSPQAMLAGLYEEYYDRIARYAFTRTGNAQTAEDIAGDTFLKALDSINRYTDQGLPMQAWLFRIAHNLVVDHLRKVTKDRVLPGELIKIVDYVDPETAAERNILMENVKSAMNELTEEQREILRLRFFGGLSSKETAQVLRKTDGAVREMQHTALAKLRLRLNE